MVLPVVISIGEILVDFIPSEIVPLKDLSSFKKCPGGAPANYIVGLSRLGIPTAFIGKVGADPFGKYLREVLEEEKVNTTNLVQATKGERTTLAFVSYDEKRDRNFFFYRKNSADINLVPEEIDKGLFKEISFLHFGSVSLTDEPVRSATFRAIDYCKENNGKVCFDPNIRLDLWNSEKDLGTIIGKALEKTDVFLPSLNELEFLFPKEGFNEQKIIDNLFETYPIEIVVVKKGKEGCLIKSRDGFDLIDHS